MPVIDEIYVREAASNNKVAIDSYNNKQIDEIVIDNQSFNFAKRKDVEGVNTVVCDNAVTENFIECLLEGNTDIYKVSDTINIFDESKLEYSAYNSTDTEWIFKSYYGVFYEIPFKQNTRYTMRFTAKQTEGNPRLVFTYSDGTTSTIGNWQLATDYTEYVGTSAANKTVVNITYQYGNSGYMYIQKGTVMLVEGATMPEYVEFVPATCNSVGDKTVNLSPINSIRKQSTSRWAYQNLGKTELAPGKYTIMGGYTQYGTQTKIQVSARDYDNINTAFATSPYKEDIKGDFILSFTIPETAKGVQIIVYINATADALETDCELYNIMLIPGTYTAETMPEFEPYSKYKIPINITGKNIYPLNNYEGNVSWTVNGAYYPVTKVECMPNTYYKLSIQEFERLTAINNGNIVLYIYDNEKLDETGRITTIALNTPGTTGLITGIPTFNSGNHNTVYMAIRNNGGYTTQIKIKGMMLEKGATATEYEPYIQPQMYNIILDEPLRKYETNTDFLDVVNGKVYRNVVDYGDGFMDGLIETLEQDIEAPQITLGKGTNTITVDTQISPSYLDVSYWRQVIPNE